MKKVALPAMISVEYRLMHGTHVFTSKDVFGLYVASEDLRTAFDAVASSIQTLLELNENISCTVRPSVTLREFLKDARGTPPEAMDQAFLMSRQFVVDCH